MRTINDQKKFIAQKKKKKKKMLWDRDVDSNMMCSTE